MVMFWEWTSLLDWWCWSVQSLIGWSVGIVGGIVIWWCHLWKHIVVVDWEHLHWEGHCHCDCVVCLWVGGLILRVGGVGWLLTWSIEDQPEQKGTYHIHSGYQRSLLHYSLYLPISSKSSQPPLPHSNTNTLFHRILPSPIHTRLLSYLPSLILFLSLPLLFPYLQPIQPITFILSSPLQYCY
jgi:hypothetical protein